MGSLTPLQRCSRCILQPQPTGPGSYQRTKKDVEHEGDRDTSSNCLIWNGPQGLSTGIERVRNRKTNGDHPNYSIVKIGQNTTKSPGDWGDLLLLRLPWKTITLSWWEKITRSVIIKLKMLWNMKVTVIPIVVGTLGKVSKKLAKRIDEKWISGGIETV